MLSAELEARRNLRIRSICSHMENKKHEIIAKSGMALEKDSQPKNLLSRPAMNFLLGTQFVASMSKDEYLQQSIAVAKYVRKNDLLPNIDKTLAQKYPHLSSVCRLILAMNIQFADEGYQNAPNGNAPVSSNRRQVEEKVEVKKKQNISFSIENVRQICFKELLKKESEKMR